MKVFAHEEISQEEADEIGFVPSALSEPRGVYSWCDNRCSDEAPRYMQIASMAIVEGGEARTINTCQRCHSEKPVHQGKQPLKSKEWREVVERKAHRGRLWKIFGCEQFLRGMWEYCSLKRAGQGRVLPKCALFAAAVCARPQRSPCPMVNATSSWWFGSARRRRERRLRCFLRHEEMAVRMALARASHHAVQRHPSTQTVSPPPAATNAATPAPSPVIEYVVPAPTVTHAALAPVFEYVAPAPVIEYIAPAPAMTCAAPSQQIPPAYTMTTVTPDVNFDITGLVNPRLSITAVETSAPQVVGSLPPFEEFDAPVYNQIHQEQIVAGETTHNTVESPAVQERVIVQEIPQLPFVERIQEQVVVTIEVLPHERVQQHTAKQIVHVPVIQIQEQSAVTGLVNPQMPITTVETSQVVGSCSLPEDFAAPVYNQVRQERIVATPQAQVIVQDIPEVSV